MDKDEDIPMENFFNKDQHEAEEPNMDLVEDAMNNAYNILTGKFKCKTIFIENADRIPLPFDPYNKNISYDKVIDLLIGHYTENEWYERCAKLVKLKDII
tara:strand:+ start:125 stop:424 length:300 start_codon:yes stop_codon:yes gene_type:complete